MKPHWVHEKIQGKLTVVICVVKSDVDLEHEAVGLRDRAQGLQRDRGQIERQVKPLHRVPGQRHVVSHQPLLAGVDGGRLRFSEVDTLSLEAVVYKKVQIFADIAVLVMLHTKLEARVPEERTQGHGLDGLPVLYHVVEEFEKFVSPVNCKLSC